MIRIISFFLIIITLIHNTSNANKEALEDSLTKIKENKISDNAKTDVKTTKSLLNYNLTEIIEEILPTVVNITVNKLENDIDNKESLAGSGFIIDSNGYIITSYHVIKNSNDIQVTLNNKKKFTAKIVGFDRKTDLALIKIDAENLPVAIMGDSNQAKIGNNVIIIGNPYGLGQSVSTGIISAKGRELQNNKDQEYIQTDAAINNGNSGGPMFNLDGKIIGITTAILSPNGNSIGLGFAIPSQIAKNVIKQLKENGKVTRGWIGVTIRDISPEIVQVMKLNNAKGAFINDIDDNSPAAKSGLIPSDIITKINNIEIEEIKTFPKIISQYEIGTKIELEVIRQGSIKKFKVEIAAMPQDFTTFDINKISNQQIDDEYYYFLGMSAIDLKQNHKEQFNIAKDIKGALITNVDEKSEAKLKGVQNGDIIIGINQDKFKDIWHLKNIIENKKKDGKLTFLIKRNDANYTITLSK